MGFKFNPFTGNLDLVDSATAAGSNTQIQFNDGGAFGGDADLTWNKTTNVLTNRGDINLDDGGSFTTTVQCVTPTANRTISFPDATGTVALVAGSSGQLLWNNAGANAGASTLTYDGSILTTSGRFINSYNATASSPAKVFTGTWFTGGTSTTTKPQVLIEPSGATSTAWSTSGTGLGVNAASGFAGNLLDLQVNGSSRARFNSDGSLLFSSSNHSINNFFSYIGFNPTGGSLSLAVGGSIIQCRVPFAFGSNEDLVIQRDAADILAQRRTTNAQTFRVYNTYTSGTNYELGKLEWFGNELRFGTEAGTGGGTLRSLGIYQGATRYQIIGSNYNQFDKDIYMNAANIVTGTSTGFKIGTGATQKLGFWNATPVAQPTAVADATDAASVITQLNALLARMRDIGLIAT
jgi:hypothetical protein